MNDKMLEQHGRMTYYLEQIEKWVKLAKHKAGDSDIDFCIEQIDRCVRATLDDNDRTDFTGCTRKPLWKTQSPRDKGLNARSPAD